MKHAVGRVEEFEPGRIKIVTVDDRSVGIVHADDRFYAVLNVCPHELAPVCEGRLSGTILPSLPESLEYGMEGRILRCPWHGYEFDLADGGRAVFTRFKARVRMFPVTVEDGVVMVEMKARWSGAASRASAST